MNLTCAGLRCTEFCDYGVVDARRDYRIVVCSLYHLQIRDHRFKYDADGSTMENEVLFIRRRNPSHVLIIQRSNHANGPSQPRPFRSPQVVESVDQSIDSGEFNCCELLNDIGTKDVVLHEPLRPNEVEQPSLETGNFFNVSADLPIELEQHQYSFLPILLVLSFGFALGDRYCQIACAVRFCTQAPNEVRRPSGNPDSDPSHADPDRRHSNSSPCSPSRPGVPPNHTIALTWRHARTQSAPKRCHKAPIQKIENNQAHIAPSLKFCGHSATRFKRKELAYG